MNLSEKEIQQAPQGASALSESECHQYLKELSEGWEYKNPQTPLRLCQSTTNFKEALELAQKLGELAERVWHHPRLIIEFKKITVEIITHDVQGLFHSDFIFAAKVDRLLELESGQSA